MDRFLARLSVAEYKRKFTIKGGILISALIGFVSRTTMDIDLTIKNLPLKKEKIETIIKEIISINTNDDVRFSFVRIESIRDEAEYDCFRISLDIFFNKIKENIKIDITIGDAITPKEIKLSYRTLIDGENISLYSYNIETVLAEKVETILSRSGLNTRMRDYYDCYILPKTYGNKIDYGVFASAIRATSNKRGSGFILQDYRIIIDELKSNDELLNRWRNYVSKNTYAQDIVLGDTIKIIEELMNKV
jgi:hypothetical protein